MSSKNVTEVVLADAEGIAKAARILEAGDLVAVPTETVYGLAARADSAEAVAKIYAAKGRPSYNPLIVHVLGVEQARKLADLPFTADIIVDHVWPGPLTMVVPLKPGAKLAPDVTAGLPTVALRSPNHGVMRALLAACDFPIAAPSANRSGFISPTTAAHVLATLDGRIEMVLDDGRPCAEGLESTIVAIQPDDTWEELRPGPIDLDGLYRFYWEKPYPRPDGPAAAKIRAPGQLASHYAPGKPVRLNAVDAEWDEFWIGFAGLGGDCTLSTSGNLTEAAERLYDCLHLAAASNKPRIAVAPIPNEDVGRAINDRLRRAATPPD